MNAPVLAFPFAIGQSSGFAELASVRILRDALTDEGEIVEAGARGTVVSVYAEAAAYEIEFENGTATVEAPMVTAA